MSNDTSQTSLSPTLKTPNRYVIPIPTNSEFLFSRVSTTGNFLEKNYAATIGNTDGNLTSIEKLQ